MGAYSETRVRREAYTVTQLHRNKIEFLPFCGELSSIGTLSGSPHHAIITLWEHGVPTILNNIYDIVTLYWYSKAAYIDLTTGIESIGTTYYINGTI